MIDKDTLDGCLKDISLPAHTREIADCATGNSCPGEVVSRLRMLPPRKYRSEDDLLCNLGNTQYCETR
jgi:hypothetical protein